MKTTNLNNKFDMTAENDTGWLTIWSAQGTLQHLSQNSFMRYRGVANTYFNNTNFNAFNIAGIYYLADISSYTNAPTSPSTFNYSFLIIIFNANIIQQIVIKSYAGKIAMREYSGNPPSWSTWKIITGS